MDNPTEQSLFESTSVDYEYLESGFIFAQPCKPITIGNFNSVFIPIIYSLVFVLGVFGNGLLIFVIARYRYSRTHTDTFILHLAVADFILVVTLPFWMVEAVGGWLFGAAMCKITGGIFALNLYSSILFLVCISFDRYLAIVHAIHMYRKRKPVYVHLTCIVVWSFCLLLATVDLIFRDVYQPSYSPLKACTYSFGVESAEGWKLALRLVHHCLGFFLPASAMLYCYCLIFRSLWRSTVFERQKTLKVVVALVVVFVVCWLPYNAVLFVDTLQSLGAVQPDCSGLNVLDISRTVTQSLGLVHSCLNPLLYAFIGVKFRREVLSLLADARYQRGSHRVSRQISKEGQSSSTF